MPSISADRVLTPLGWKQHQLISIDDLGIITAIEDHTQQSFQHHSELIIPGFINLHSHAFQWSMAGLAENFGKQGDSFWSWRELMYQLVQKIDAEDISIIAEALYIDMLKAGYTEVGEFHYLHNDVAGNRYAQPELLSIRVIEAARSAGIAICHLPVLYQQAGFNQQPLAPLQHRFHLTTDEIINLNQTLNSIYASDDLVRIGIAPHSLRAVDLPQLNNLLAGIDSASPIHIHIAEQLAEVEQSVAATSYSPVNLLFDQVEISNSWCLIHATHLRPEEITKIVESGATVGLCPSTEANLGDGLFPLTKYSTLAGKWGIGSDSHVSVDPKHELRLLEYGQRLNSFNRVVYSDAENPSTATNLLLDSAQGGKQALQSAAGAIQVGNRADLLSLKIPPHYQHYSAEQLASKWIYCSRENWINDVMVAGQWKIVNGQHSNQQKANNELFKVLKKLTKI